VDPRGGAIGAFAPATNESSTCDAVGGKVVLREKVLVPRGGFNVRGKVRGDIGDAERGCGGRGVARQPIFNQTFGLNEGIHLAKDLIQGREGCSRSGFVWAKERDEPEVEGVPSVVFAEANAYEGLTKGQQDLAHVEW
jgi:hypothetical protein